MPNFGCSTIILKNCNFTNGPVVEVAFGASEVYQPLPWVGETAGIAKLWKNEAAGVNTCQSHDSQKGLMF